MIEQIAKTAHSVHRAYCIANNISTQPEWDSVEQEHKEVVYNSIKSILNGEISSLEESHNKFVESKKSQGWTYGQQYDITKKTNPRLVPFENLNLSQKTKEMIFFECVNSFK